jgi:hypothetical protein
MGEHSLTSTEFSKLMIVSLMLILLLGGCSLLVLDEQAVFNTRADKTKSLLIVVNKALSPSLSASLTQYRQALSAQGCTTFLTEWETGTVEDLKAMLSDYYSVQGINGALLIGDLPAAWYKADCFERVEQFPTDIFLMDLDARWEDRNGDGLYDAHSGLKAEIYTSRLIGTAQEINMYFAKLARYRAGTLNIPAKAYVFKDDDWQNYSRGDSFGLTGIYATVDKRENADETLKDMYVSDLSVNGAEYVYQWIHANPSSLYIKENDIFKPVDLSQIKALDFKAAFYNLFDCSASRFTQDNIAMSCLMKTDYALATTGSTKIGGNYYPVPFNYVLEREGTWGDAFKYWYNTYAASDDCWFLGMTILGDPALTVSRSPGRTVLLDFETRGSPAGTDVQSLTDIYNSIEPVGNEKTYTDYLRANRLVNPGN